MCYKSPGARCYSHGKEDYEKKEKSFVDATIIAVKTGNPEAMQKAEEAKNEMLKAEMDMYASKEGLGVLKEKLDKQFANKEITGNQRDDQYNAARNTYTKKMDAYDQINKTVDGRKPSNEYTAEGQRALTSKINEYTAIVAEARKDRNKQYGADKLTDVIGRLQKRLDHARATKSHITKGLITAEDVEKSHGAVTKSGDSAAVKATTPKTRTSSKKQEPFLAEPVKRSDDGWVGAKYDGSRTNQQVASLTRADIKKAAATGALPSEYQYKVSNRGNRIQIDIIGEHKDNLDSYTGARGGLITRVSSEGMTLRDKVSAYANQYAYNKSQAQFDNFNQSHSIFVDFIDGETGKNVRH